MLYYTGWFMNIGNLMNDRLSQSLYRQGQLKLLTSQRNHPKKMIQKTDHPVKWSFLFLATQ